MNKQIFEDKKLGEKFTLYTHSSGCKIYICEKPEYSSAYATFGTRYGSVDTRFRIKGETEFTEVPEGIAHFLEHKMFEKEYGDVFNLYAKTGASANAYTTFDRTSYLFSCTDRFDESFGILLDFVQQPYFTKESVEKEQGIIGQEIEMYLDSPSSRLLFNLLEAMYKNHPVRIDIPGTVESISHIDADLLYKCYNTFYNLNNMYICVAGNVTADGVIRLSEEHLKNTAPVEIERGLFDEPYGIAQDYIEQRLAVSLPMFAIGFKERCDGDKALKEKVLTDLLAETIAGESSPFYKRMFEAGMINDKFSSAQLTGHGYASTIFEGESSDPKAVFAALKEEIDRVRAEGVDAHEFENARRRYYGSLVRRFNSVDDIAESLGQCAFDGVSLYDDIAVCAAATVGNMNEHIKTVLDTSNSALSVILPADGDK